MALTEIPIELSSTPGIVDNSNATAITIDASENVGIGTSSPAAKLDLGTSTGQKLLMYANSNIKYGMSIETSDYRIFAEDQASLTFGHMARTDGTTYTERLRIDASGNVGIGTASPSSFFTSARNLVVGTGTGNNGMTIYSQSTGVGDVAFADATTDPAYYSGLIRYDHSLDAMRLFTSSTERMRIDSSGNLLVGKTASNSTVAGSQLNANGLIIGTTSETNPLLLNRLSTDGDIAVFQKSGVAVGSIGSASGVTYFAGPNSSTGGFRIDSIGANGVIVPTTTVGANRDAALDLGMASTRFKDLYLSGGVYLGGTGAANKLDDYEEGTWTPTVTSSGGTITTVTSQIGTYTKIGRTVIVQYQFNIATLGTASGNIIVSGRPFTEDNSAISYYAGVHRARAGASSITEFDPDGTFQLYGTTPVTNVYLGSMVYNTTS